jgi:Flp pilus assembly pilin Flp
MRKVQTKMIKLGFGWLNQIGSEAGPEQEGQSLVEYAMILLLIVIACILALMATATAINDLWNTISATLGPVFSI